MKTPLSLALLGLAASLASGGGEFGGFATPKSCWAGDGSIDTAIGDLDGNGTPDLAAADEWADAVTILFGDDRGKFAYDRSYASVQGVRSVALADIDGDGALDVASTGPYEGVWVSVRRNRGDGTFEDERRFQVGLAPEFLAFGDLDRDGSPDLVVSNWTTADVSVLIADRRGGFSPERRYPLGSPAQQIALVDVDRDGYLDATCSCPGTAEIRVLLNDGRGGLGPAIATATGGFASGMAVGDLDRDGEIDVVTSQLYDGTAAIFLGRGDGTFDRGPVESLGGETLVGVVIADLDRDRRADLALIDETATKVIVALGRGDGTFEAPLRYPCGSYPQALAAADLDHDGFLDLVVSNPGTDDVHVLINKTVLPEARRSRARS